MNKLNDYKREVKKIRKINNENIIYHVNKLKKTNTYRMTSAKQ